MRDHAIVVFRTHQRSPQPTLHHTRKMNHTVEECWEYTNYDTLVLECQQTRDEGETKKES